METQGHRIGPDNREESMRKGRDRQTERQRGTEERGGRHGHGEEQAGSKYRGRERHRRERAQPPCKAPWFSFPQYQFLQLGSILASSTSSIDPVIPHPTHTPVWISPPAEPAPSMGQGCFLLESRPDLTGWPPPKSSPSVTWRLCTERAADGIRTPIWFWVHWLPCGGHTPVPLAIFTSGNWR